MDDVDQAVASLARVRSVRTLCDRLTAIAPEIESQVIEQVAARQPGLVRSWLLDGNGNADTVSSEVLAAVFGDADDATIDRAIVDGSWILLTEPVRGLAVSRLGRATDNAPALRGHQRLLWSDHAAGLAAAADAGLLHMLHHTGMLHSDGALGLDEDYHFALEAASRAGLALHPLASTDPPRAEVRAFSSSLLAVERLVDDEDLAWVIDHRTLLSETGGGGCKAWLTPAQRLALFATTHPVLALYGVQAWARPGTRGPTTEELAHVRAAAEPPAGYRLMAEVLLSPRALGALGQGWVLTWVATTDRVGDLAWCMQDDRRLGALPVQVATAIGERLTGWTLAGWLRRISPRARCCVAAALGPAGLALHCQDFLGRPDLCVELPHLPAAIAAVIADSDGPPTWAAHLVTGVLGNSPLVYDAAQQLIDGGFRGSFLDLRRHLFGPQEPYHRQRWYTLLCRTLRADRDQLSDG